MGSATADLVNSVTLSCQPTDSNNDGKVDVNDVQVRAENGAIIKDFTLSGTKLTFTNNLPVGITQLTYYCVQ